VAVVAAVWCGLVMGRGVGQPAVWVCLSLALPLAGLACRAPARVGTALTLLSLVVAAAARGGAEATAQDHGAAELADPVPRWILVRVVGHPLRESGEPLAVVRLLAPSPPLPAGTPLRLRLPSGCNAEWGDTVSALAVLERARPRSNPGGFSPREAAGGMGLAVYGRALAARVFQARGGAAWARGTAVRWRRGVERVLSRSLDEESRHLVAPLVVGDRSALPPELTADLRTAGLPHLLALSGLHVAWLAGAARVAASVLGLGVRGRALAGAACAVFYGLVAGPLPSLMRAGGTELVMTAARIAGRAVDPLQALALSALALLVVAPAWAVDLGFQLSCATTLGLVTAGAWLTGRCGRLRSAASPFIPTLAAQLLALPFLLDRFHALPCGALLTNLLAVPACGALLASAWLGIAVACVLPGAEAPFFASCSVFAAVLRGIARAAGRIPGLLVATGAERGVPTLAAAGGALLAFASAGPRDLAARGRRASPARHAAGLIGGIATSVALALVLTASPLRPAPGRWWLVVLDVGQGDAAALAFPDGWWLVDAGPRTPRYDAGESVVLPFLRWAGVHRLERLVVTHDDGDHAGGARAVLRGIPVTAAIVPAGLPGVPGPGPKLQGIAAPVVPVTRGDTLHRRPRVVVLWPPRAAVVDGDNAASLVLEIGDGGGLVLAADVDSTREDSLSVTGPLAALKVSHHGAGSSSGARFVRRAAPAIAIVSCGRRNPFGHPDPAALARLEAAGARIARTDRDGAAWFEFTAGVAEPVDWRSGAPRRTGMAPHCLVRRGPDW